MNAAPEKKNPAVDVEAGLPSRVGGAIGTRDFATNPTSAQLPSGLDARFWHSMGRIEATLDRLEARLGIVREVGYAG